MTYDPINFSRAPEGLPAVIAGEYRHLAGESCSLTAARLTGQPRLSSDSAEEFIAGMLSPSTELTPMLMHAGGVAQSPSSDM